MKLGKHFLINEEVADKIVESLNLQKDDVVVEIGGGRGILSERIAPKVKKFFVIELDKSLYNLLIYKLSKYTNTEIIHANFLEVNLESFSDKLKVVGNIPYSITSKILSKIYEENNWSCCVLMLQKEVAEKLVAQPTTNRFSKLTLINNFYTKTELLFYVKHDCFLPQPKVDSAVVRFVPNNIYKNFENKEKLFKLIDAVFKYKRKTLINSLSFALKKNKKLLQEILENLDIKLTTRPQDVGLDTYIKLLEKISSFIK